MKKLLKRVTASKPTMVILASLFIIILAVGAFFLGDKHGIETMTFRRVTSDQLATAMHDDHFYSSYRENTLLVRGTVASISNTNGDSIVGFKSTLSFKAACDFGAMIPVVHQGETITVLSEAGVAERQPSGVLLKDCLIP
jgi:hypothetical protein